MTTKQAAKMAKVSVATFRKKAAALKLKPSDVAQTGKRGRPQFVWSNAAISKIAGL